MVQIWFFFPLFLSLLYSIFMNFEHVGKNKKNKDATTYAKVARITRARLCKRVNQSKKGISELIP